MAQGAGISPGPASGAESYLSSLDPIGWHFGLERITALLGELGEPQLRYETIHVVGTNGKSSVSEMTAALLEAHGVPAGAYLSPHRARWAERVRIGGAEQPSELFEAAVARVAAATDAIAPTLPEGESVTQFEASTAAAFLALAEAGVECAVIEAGLGGRLDATNVLSSRATVLTSVGLDHTQWLGETELEIATEKLAVLTPGSVLVLGAVAPPITELARVTARERSAQLVVASQPGPAVRLASPAPYLRRDLGVAIAAASVIAGELVPARVAEVAAALELPGRSELVAGDPPVLLDAAHNAEGAAALAEAMPQLAAGRPVVACLAILADKDARAIVAALAPTLAAAVCTELPADALAGSGRPDASWRPADALAELCAEAGVRSVEVEPDPARAVARAMELARERGGVALVAGSHYLLGSA